MKLAVVVLAVCAAAICAGHVLPEEDLPTVPGDNSHYVEGRSRYIWMPNGLVHGDDEAVLVDLQEPIDTELLNEITRNPANNLYLLYTRRNPTSSQILQMNNANSITNSNFNPRLPIKVIVHGWLSNQNSNINPTIRDAFLSREDCNVIVLDWRRLALSGYVTAANGVPAVGRGLGQFLNWLCSVTGASLSQIHLTGFSLGAHLVGNAGRQLGGRVARVTGMDPAGPLWNLNRNRLRPSDGIYVEGIHTDGGYTVGGLGIGSDVAHVDFYVNGGISQPGCLTNICNHNNAWRYFAASVRYNHLIGDRCSNSLQISLNTCRGPKLPMGNSYLNKRGSGQFRVNTGRNYPY